MEFKITLLDAALVQFVQQALIKVSHYSSYLLWEASEFGLMVIHSPQIWDKEYQKQEEGQITAEQEALQDYILSATVIVWICPLDYTSNQTYVYPSYTYFQFSDEEASEDLNGWKRAYSYFDVKSVYMLFDIFFDGALFKSSFSKNINISFCSQHHH